MIAFFGAWVLAGWLIVCVSDWASTRAGRPFHFSWWVWVIAAVLWPLIVVEAIRMARR